MFRRRNPKTFLEWISDAFYPRGGWARAASYVVHRLRRLPDPPHRIARGVAIGVFVSFTPFFGFHFVLATLLALTFQGNVLAALLGTFFGNPITFPFIILISYELGTWILGIHHSAALPEIVDAFGLAMLQLWSNLMALVTDETAHWNEMGQFLSEVILPYFVGGLIPGLACATVAFILTRPAVSAYQKGRIKRLKARYEKRRQLAQRRADSQGQTR